MASSGVRLTTQVFKERAMKVHNGLYSYGDNLKYLNYYTKVPIICPIHGEYHQKPSEHLNGKGCPTCGRKRTIESTHKSKEAFIKRSMEIHGDEYEYSMVDYINCKTKVKIICKKHGVFLQTPDKHINAKQGCPICYGKNRRTTDDIIKDFKLKHGDRYDYSKVEYKNYDTKVEIVCHKKDSNGTEHGSFFQSPSHHISGCSCPRCNQSHLENDVENALLINGIEYEKQRMFSWLGKKKLDFYIPSHKIAIECQGEQHYKPIDFFGGAEKFMIQNKRDLEKRDLCSKNGIIILYYTESRLANNGDFKSLDELINEIKTTCDDRHDDNG